MRDRLGDGEIAHAGLHPRGAVLDIDLEDAVELREAQEHPVGERKGAAGEPGTRAAGHHRDALPGAEAEYLLDLLGGVGQHRHHGELAVGGEAVALVGAKPFLVVQHALRGQDAPELRNQRVQTDIGHRLAPHLPAGAGERTFYPQETGVVGEEGMEVFGPVDVGFPAGADPSSSRSRFVARAS